MSKLKQLLFSLNETDKRVIEEKLKTQDQQIDQLKQQNEELMLQLSKYEIEKHKPAYCTLAGTECEYLGNVDELKQQPAEKDKEINSLIVDYEKRISQEQKLMSNMEHLLTEKQNAIDEINKEFAQAVHDWKVLCAEKDKKIELLNTMISTLPAHDKEIKEHELEKVKDFILENTMLETETAAVLTYIYQQIKELKGENK